MRFIRQHKAELIDYLRADHSFILQHAQTSDIITDRQYDELKHSKTPEQTVTGLIDQVMTKGQNACSRFIDVLKKPEILCTYPLLKELTKN